MDEHKQAVLGMVKVLEMLPSNKELAHITQLQPFSECHRL